jgi:superfamily II DNA/RNA helicase
MTGAGREGLNLQRATTLIHFDLPWVPSQVVQRMGRASRIGSTASNLNNLILVMAGTIEERVAAKLIPRAATALAVLDTHRGVDSKQTELGLSLAGLADVVSEQEVGEATTEGIFQMARELLG